jgi:hypothetical protein
MSTITQLRPGSASDHRALSPKSVLARLDRIDAWPARCSQLRFPNAWSASYGCRSVP